MAVVGSAAAVSGGPAAELGMATVHHLETEETIAELERLLGLPLM